MHGLKDKKEAVKHLLLNGFLFPSSSEGRLIRFQVFRDALRMKLSGDYFFSHLQAILQGLSCLKKSLPLSSTRMKAGKFSTVIL